MRTLKRSIWPPILTLSLVALAATGAVTADRATATPPAPVTVGQEHKHEDDPGFDCRFDGNKQCGVLLDGVWNVITYNEAGEPVHVQPRDL